MKQAVQWYSAVQCCAACRRCVLAGKGSVALHEASQGCAAHLTAAPKLQLGSVSLRRHSHFSSRRRLTVLSPQRLSGFCVTPGKATTAAAHCDARLLPGCPERCCVCH